MTDDDLRLGLHEAAHCVIAHAHRWPVRMTIMGGETLRGCSPTEAPPQPLGAWLGSPLWEWPLHAREWHESMMMLFLAGDAGEDLAVRHPARRGVRAQRRGPSVADAAAEIAAELPAPTEDERAYLAEVVSRSGTVRNRPQLS